MTVIIFVLLIESILPPKQQKCGPAGVEVLWSSEVGKNRKINPCPPQLLGTDQYTAKNTRKFPEYQKRKMHRLKSILKSILKTNTAQKDFFSKCDQMPNFLRIWSHLLKISLIKNVFFGLCKTTILFLFTDTLYIMQCNVFYYSPVSARAISRVWTDYFIWLRASSNQEIYENW